MTDQSSGAQQFVRLDPADVEDLRVGARRAKVAVFVGAPLFAASPALEGHQERENRRAEEEFRAQFERQTQSPTVPVLQVRQPPNFSNNASSPLLSLSALVIGVLFLIWFFRAATIASSLGRRAQRTPGWAVGGWFVPIGNLFIPYQSARDLFEPGDASRQFAKNWWAAYVIAFAFGSPLGTIAGRGDHTAVSVAVGALGFVLWLYAAYRANLLIDEATDSLVGGPS